MTPDETAPAPDAAKTDFIRGEELAEIFRVHRGTITRWRKAGLLRGYKIGRFIFYRRAEAIATIEAQLQANPVPNEPPPA